MFQRNFRWNTNNLNPSLYQLFTIMRAANYRYLEFVSAFDDHSGNQRKLTEVCSPVIDNERCYRRLNFFDARNLEVLGAISRGRFITFGVRGKDIRNILSGISPSAMSRIFKRLRLHGILERGKGIYKYFSTDLGKEVITAEPPIRNKRYLLPRKNFAILRKISFVSA